MSHDLSIKKGIEIVYGVTSVSLSQIMRAPKVATPSLCMVFNKKEYIEIKNSLNMFFVLTVLRKMTWQYFAFFS